MDCLSPSSRYSRVVYMKPAQITEAGGHWSTFLIWAKSVVHHGPGGLPAAV
jgi:hypothetical protein